MCVYRCCQGTHLCIGWWSQASWSWFSVRILTSSSCFWPRLGFLSNSLLLFWILICIAISARAPPPLCLCLYSEGAISQSLSFLGFFVVASLWQFAGSQFLWFHCSSSFFLAFLSHVWFDWEEGGLVCKCGWMQAPAKQCVWVQGAMCFFSPRLSVFSHVLVLASILIVVDLVFCGRASSICSSFASKCWN